MSPLFRQNRRVTAVRGRNYRRSSRLNSGDVEALKHMSQEERDALYTQLIEADLADGLA